MQTQTRFSNNKIAAILLITVAAMVGLSFASVPLYDLFCRVTGIGGTTQIAQSNNPNQTNLTERFFDINFDANIDSELAWKFKPAQTIKNLPIGKPVTVYYTAENLTNETTTGSATFNVTPLKAGQYFYKIECFCFTEQTLKPREKTDMFVQFYIDPDIQNNKNLSDVNNITLSYTMYSIQTQ